MMMTLVKKMAGLALLLLLLAACKGKKNNQQDLVTYNIPEIDKLSAEISQNPNNPALYAARSLFFSEYELLKEAELDAEKALSLDSTQADYYRLLANAYFENNHSMSATRIAKKAIEQFPDVQEFYLLLGEMQLQIMQFDDGLLTLDKMMKAFPNHPDGLFIQGLILKEKGDTIQALDRFQTVVEQDADYIDAYLQLALLAKSMNKKICLRYFDNALRIDSMNATALLGKAQYYHFEGDFEQAQKEYETAIIRSPQNPDFNYNLALMYMELGTNKKDNSYFEKALQHFDNSTKFDPQFADAYYYKGLAALALDQKTNALTDFENALRLQSFLGTVHPETVEAAIEQLQ